MAGSVNKVILIGHLGQDPEVRTFQNGGKVCNLSTAISLPALPWVDGDTLPRDPRHETAPRRDVVTPQHRITPEDFIAALRRECVRARKEGIA